MEDDMGLKNLAAVLNDLVSDRNAIVASVRSLQHRDVLSIKAHNADPLLFSVKKALEYCLDLTQFDVSIEGSPDKRKLYINSSLKKNHGIMVNRAMEELSGDPAALKVLRVRIQQYFREERINYMRSEINELSLSGIEDSVSAHLPSINAFFAECGRVTAVDRTPIEFKLMYQLLTESYSDLIQIIKNYDLEKNTEPSP